MSTTPANTGLLTPPSNVDANITVADPDAEVPDAAIEAVASLLLDAVGRQSVKRDVHHNNKSVVDGVILG